MKTTMKKVTSAAALACFMTIGIQSASAQVGMSGNNPDKSAALDLNATNKGLLVPRVNLASLSDKASINGGNPAVSLMVYNTNATLGAGFYYWNGTAWVKLSITGEGDNLGNHSATKDIAMNNNSVNGAYKVSSTYAQISNGAGANKVAVSDASGNLNWTDPTTISTKGDNLGNHSATKDITMNNNSVTGAYKLSTTYAQISNGAGANKVAVSDATGNVVWTDPATIAMQGDNLGNHTATKTLDMAKNDINNINNAYVKNDLHLIDHTASNTKDFILYKSDGKFGVYNSLKGGNDIEVNEETRKTIVNNLAINKGAGDGEGAPAIGYIAVANSVGGDVVWRNPASITTKATQVKAGGAIDGNAITVTGDGVSTPYTISGDNLGNHTATLDLQMKEKIVNFADNSNAYKIRFADSNNGARIDLNPGYVVKNVAGFSGKGNGEHVWINYDGTLEKERMRLNSSGLTVADKVTTQAAQIKSGAGVNKIAVSDKDGNLVWTDPANITTKGTATQVKAGGAIDGNAITVTGDGVSTPYTISGDNLGNHTAITDIKMNNNSVTGAYKLTGKYVQATEGAGVNRIAVSDKDGNVVWTEPASITTKSTQVKAGGAIDGNVITVSGDGVGTPYTISGDNLGNHKATTTLDMAKNDINNINNAYVNNDLHLKDHAATKTKDFILYKNDGKFGIYNSLKGGNDIEVNEETRTTTVNNLAITNSAQGSGPAAGSIATSVDDKGNVVWKPASDIAKGTITGKNVISVSNGSNNSFKDTDISLTAGGNNQVLKTVNGVPTWSSMAGSWMGLITGGDADLNNGRAVLVQFTDTLIIGSGGSATKTSITVPVSGLYEIVINGHTRTPSNTPWLTTWEVRQNGTTIWYPHYGSPKKEWGNNAGATSYFHLNAGDVMTLYLSNYYDSTQVNIADSTSFCIKLMQ